MNNSKVIWSEGLFIRPQHFQQQDRYFENLLESRCKDLTPYSWGIQSVSIDQEMLSLGKFGLQKCQAVLPDGTVVNIPEEMPSPSPIDITEDLNNEIVFLALPLKRHDAVEIVEKDNVTDNLARYVIAACEVNDNNSCSSIKINIGQLRLRFLLEHETRGEYACLAIAKIKEVRSNNVILDEEFIPPSLNCHAISKLSGYIKELLGLLRYRGEALALRATDSGRGLAEVSDFMLLQTVNRFEPLLLHFSELVTLHPESFYREIVQMAGEFASFTHDNKRPHQFPAYKHEDLQATFKPVMDDLRQALSLEIDQNVFAIPLQYRGPGNGVGLYVAPMAETIGEINVHYLLDKAHFILAVKAKVSNEILVNEFPKQVKIGAVERIQRMVKLNLPGVRVIVTRAVPRQIPIHGGFVYFELDQKSDYWKDMSNSGGFAIHIGDKFQDIELELWAIKI